MVLAGHDMPSFSAPVLYPSWAHSSARGSATQLPDVVAADRHHPACCCSLTGSTSWTKFTLVTLLAQRTCPLLRPCRVRSAREAVGRALRPSTSHLGAHPHLLRHHPPPPPPPHRLRHPARRWALCQHLQKKAPCSVWLAARRQRSCYPHLATTVS